MVGLDAVSTLLLVEFRLGIEHLLAPQGLDYRIWAEAIRSRLTQLPD